MSTARAIADLSEGTILATVDIAAPPERVFQALTTEEVTRWWGSADTYRTTEWTADLRVGGRWRAGGRGKDGDAFSVQGEYLEIDPPRKLVQTWQPDWEGPHVTTIAYLLEPIEGGTRITLRHTGFSGRPESCAGHANGWERVLGWLVKHFAPPAPDKFFMCRLVGPRPTFPADATPAEKTAMQQHVAYWTELLNKGTAIVFGPVAEPTGVWGLAVVRVASPAEAEGIVAKDPTMLSGLGFRFDAYPMLSAVARA